MTKMTMKIIAVLVYIIVGILFFIGLVSSGSDIGDCIAKNVSTAFPTLKMIAYGAGLWVMFLLLKPINKL